MQYVATQSLSIISVLKWAKIGFGPNVSSFGQLLEAFEPFVLTAQHLSDLRSLPVFVNDPVLDTATNMQSSLLWSAIAPQHSSSVLFQPKLESGVGLHCGVGSNIQNANNILDWIANALAKK
jgi:hypothetical protein